MQKDDLLKVKGTHIISICDASDKRAWNLECLIEGVRAKRNAILKSGKATIAVLQALHEEYNWYIDQLHKRFLIDQKVVENLTTTVGRAVVAQRLAGITTYTGTVNYCALGSNNTSPLVGDTQLNTEVYRKGLSSGVAASNVAVLETFFSATETNGTYQEYGFFIDGNASANSGQLFNRFVATTTKSSVQTMNVQSTITIAST